MKLLHVIHSANPAGGGPIEAVKRFAAAHIAEGHSVEVVSLDSPDAPWARGFPIPLHTLGPGMFNYGYTAKFVPWLREHRTRFDAVIVNGIWQYSSFGTWRALRDGG